MTTQSKQPETTRPAQQFQPGREKTGGRQKGVGNKKKKALDAVLSEIMTYRDMLHVYGMMISQAKKGDKDARKELLNRLHGKAPMAVDININDTRPILRAPFAGPRPRVIDVDVESTPWTLGDDRALAEKLAHDAAVEAGLTLDAPTPDRAKIEAPK